MRHQLLTVYYIAGQLVMIGWASQCQVFFSGRLRILDKTKRSLFTTL